MRTGGEGLQQGDGLRILLAVSAHLGGEDAEARDLGRQFDRRQQGLDVIVGREVGRSLSRFGQQGQDAIVVGIEAIGLGQMNPRLTQKIAVAALVARLFEQGVAQQAQRIDVVRRGGQDALQNGDGLGLVAQPQFGAGQQEVGGALTRIGGRPSLNLGQQGGVLAHRGRQAQAKQQQVALDGGQGGDLDLRLAELFAGDDRDGQALADIGLLLALQLRQGHAGRGLHGGNDLHPPLQVVDIGVKHRHPLGTGHEPVRQQPGLGVIHGHGLRVLELERAPGQDQVQRQPGVVVQPVGAASIDVADDHARRLQFGVGEVLGIALDEPGGKTCGPGQEGVHHEVVGVFVQQGLHVAPLADRQGEDFVVGGLIEAGHFVAQSRLDRLQVSEPLHQIDGDPLRRGAVGVQTVHVAQGVFIQLQLQGAVAQRPLVAVAIDDEARRLGTSPFGRQPRCRRQQGQAGQGQSGQSIARHDVSPPRRKRRFSGDSLRRLRRRLSRCRERPFAKRGF
ncbi:hypothetical protein D3C85_911930 [compost metagenome]